MILAVIDVSEGRPRIMDFDWAVRPYGKSISKERRAIK